MADEFEVIPNPDNVPGAVSTGYQAQNTILEAQRNGLDLSYVSSVVGQSKINVDISGGVDVNGLLYVCKTAVELSVSSGTFYVKLAAGSTVDFLTPTITSDSGTFDATKNAYYTSGGERVLNWVLISNGSTNVDCYERKNSLQITKLKVDTVNEKTDGSGVIIEDVLLKDSKVNSKATFANFIHSSTTLNSNTMFEALNPYLPNTHDEILITGAGLYVGSGLNNECSFSRAKKINATRIEMYGYDFTANNFTTHGLVDNNTSNLYSKLSISW